MGVALDLPQLLNDEQYNIPTASDATILADAATAQL
jgi:hypothetical protein